MLGINDFAELGAAVWDNRTTARSALLAVRRWWKKQRVLVIGPGGTGKTTLAHLFAGQVDWLEIAPWKYEQSINVDRLRMKENLSVEMVVAPGDKPHRPATWPRVQKDIASGRYKGVVLVSSYGHHSLSGVGLKTIKPGIPKDRALQDFLAERRADELEVVAQLGGAVTVYPTKLWLLSVVTKQDLWYSDEPAVRAHYTAGEYDTIIRSVAGRKATGSFRHEYRFVSLFISNYTTPRNETLKKNAEGYDQRMQIESAQGLHEAVLQMIAWEAER